MKRLLIILTAVILMFMLPSCALNLGSSSEDMSGDSSGGIHGDEDILDNERICMVSFDVDGSDSIIESQLVNAGEQIVKPDDPNPKITAKGEYEFVGWYYCGKEWIFETDVVQNDMTLVAQWKLVVEYTIPFLPT